MKCVFLRIKALTPLFFGFLFCLPLFAENPLSKNTQQTLTNTGISALWILANLSYAGMRAQGKKKSFWKIISFLIGLPGTFFSFFLIVDGSETAFGVELPRKRKDDQRKKVKTEFLEAMKPFPKGETRLCENCQRPLKRSDNLCLYCGANPHEAKNTAPLT